MGREIRRVPANWEHPKKSNREYKTLCEYDDKHECNCEYCEVNGEDYMPIGKWYQLFENVSEGSPLSPPFKTKEELIKWLSENKDYWGNFWGKEGAESIVDKGYAPSGIITNSRFYSPHEQHKIKK